MIGNSKEQILLKEVSIIQDCIPKYRWAFFEALYSIGIKENICYTVYSSDPIDSNFAGSFKAVHIANRKIKLGRLTRWHTNLDELLKSDLVILEQALHNPMLLWRFLLRGPHLVKTYLWGHGGYWTRRNNWLQEKILWYVIRKADHFLAYTDGGREILRKNGYPVDKITVLRNSIDTQRILNEIKELSPKEHSEWLRKHNLHSLHLGCFIGEFRSEKDLPFLISALVKIRSHISDFEFIFFGGEMGRSQIERSLREYSWITYGGFADSKVKAHLSRAGAVILNPGRVGLIAVDSMAMGAPIVTRNLKDSHAPEFEYLNHPESILVTEDNLDAYVIQSVSLFNNSEVKKQMSITLSQLALTFSAEDMAQNFHSAVRANI